MINLDYNKMGGLVPVIVQDSLTMQVLMLGYMNEEALEKTIQTKLVTFYSRSKQRLWVKGETSGNYLKLVDWKIDCDRDTLLVFARPQGPTCHKGTATCFGGTNDVRFDVAYLERVIKAKQGTPAETSYTSSLLQKGINKVAQKLGEEAVELIIEAKDDDKALFLGEAADLMYHYLVLLTAKGYAFKDVLQVLEERHQQ